MGAEPDYSEEIAKEIDDEIRRVIEEAHDKATNVLREHMDELHKLSAILIERETIDKSQFERLLQGESEESVFAEEPAAAETEPEAEAEKKPPSARSRGRPRCGDAAAARPGRLLAPAYPRRLSAARPRASRRATSSAARAHAAPIASTASPSTACEIDEREEGPDEEQGADPERAIHAGRRQAPPGSSRVVAQSSRDQPTSSPTISSPAATPAARTSSGGSPTARMSP